MKRGKLIKLALAVLIIISMIMPVTAIYGEVSTEFYPLTEDDLDYFHVGTPDGVSTLEYEIKDNALVLTNVGGSYPNFIPNEVETGPYDASAELYVEYDVDVTLGDGELPSVCFSMTAGGVENKELNFDTNGNHKGTFDLKTKMPDGLAENEYYFDQYSVFLVGDGTTAVIKTFKVVEKGASSAKPTETPAETNEPTEAPTETPTVTVKPTASPTKAPTNAPSSTVLDEGDNDNSNDYTIYIIIGVAAVVIIAGVCVYFFVIKKKK